MEYSKFFELLPCVKDMFTIFLNVPLLQWNVKFFLKVSLRRKIFKKIYWTFSCPYKMLNIFLWCSSVPGECSKRFGKYLKKNSNLPLWLENVKFFLEVPKPGKYFSLIFPCAKKTFQITLNALLRLWNVQNIFDRSRRREMLKNFLMFPCCTSAMSHNFSDLPSVTTKC